MELVSVNSSNIRAVGYEEETATLYGIRVIS